jgi:uncharacterized protein (DUF58 family)
MSLLNPNADVVTAHGAEGSLYFEPARLAGLEKMRFTTNRRVEGAYSGRHVAKRRGGAGEFVDYREYSPGDDLRKLDWKALARTGRTYLKLFQDETDLRCTIVLDTSGSMAQGSRSSRDHRGSKLAWSQYFATALSHLIVLGRDAVGLCTVGNSFDKYVAPLASMSHRSLVHQTIEGLRPQGETDLAKGLDSLLLQSGRRGVLLVLSDFLVPDMQPLISALRKFRSRGWEIIALHVTHPDEVTLPEGQAFRFLDWETNGQINCQMSEIRTAYAARFQEHLRVTRGGLLSIGCDYHLVDVSHDYMEALRNFYVSRSA